MTWTGDSIIFMARWIVFVKLVLRSRSDLGILVMRALVSSMPFKMTNIVACSGDKKEEVEVPF